MAGCRLGKKCSPSWIGSALWSAPDSSCLGCTIRARVRAWPEIVTTSLVLGHVLPCRPGTGDGCRAYVSRCFGCIFTAAAGAPHPPASVQVQVLEEMHAEWNRLPRMRPWRVGSGILDASFPAGSRPRPLHRRGRLVCARADNLPGRVLSSILHPCCMQAQTGQRLLPPWTVWTVLRRSSM